MFLPLFSFSPEEIFSGDILLFDVDFFNPQTEVYAKTEVTTTTSTTTTSVDGITITQPDSTETSERDILITDNTNLQEELDHSDESSQDSQNYYGTYEVSTTTVEENVKYYYYINDEGEEVITSKQNTALDLQPLVSKWYMAIRNIAIVLSMSVLLYIGIRMLLSSVSQEKAKYKQMLIDWVVGVCLLFFMHYIMVFSVTIVQSFNDIISTTREDTIGQTVLMEDDEEGYISDKLEELGMTELIDDSSDPTQIMWPTNLMGMLRLKAQVSYGDMAFVGYGLCYVILVIYTVYFSFVYLRRVLYMAFLTMIAPLVALTYPIDKVNDGQAQGFNKWLKEYIFNLLLQPLHLLLYTLLITSAYELSSTNVVYSLVAIGFMIPAEKLMRSLFGFEKASTPGSFAGAAAGAAMLNSGLQKVLHGGSGGKNGKGKDGSGSDDDNSAPPRIGYNADNDSENDDNSESPRIGDNADNADDSDNDSDNDSEATPQQAMLDAYDDNYGTDDWDPAERDQMAREAYRNDGGMQYSDDEYRDILRDSGYSDEEIAELMGDGNHGSNDGNEDNDEQIRLDENGQSDEEDRESANQADEEDRENANQADEEEPQQSEDSRQTISRPQGIRNRIRANTESNKDFLQRMGRATTYTARQGARKLTKMAPKAIRTGAKVAAGVALGATAAAAGATIGIATGDPSKVASFAAGAAVAGGTLGASRINTNPSHTKSAAQIARERAFWGEDYEKHVAEENMKKWKKDIDKRENLERYLGREKTKKLYDDGRIDDYLKNEITSEKDIAALETLQEKNSDINFKDALLIFDAYDKYGDIDRQKDKDKKDIRGGYAEKFQKAGVSEQSAKKKAEKITKMTTNLDQIKKNFQ